MKIKRFLLNSLHIFVLTGFALAQPLLDLLSRDAEFFVARHSEPVDVVSLLLVICLIVPLILVMAEWLIGLLGKEKYKAFHLLLIVLLAGLVIIPLCKKAGALPGFIQMALSVLAGIIFVLAYVKVQYVRTFLTMLSPAILVFPCLFLFQSPILGIVFPGQSSGYSAAAAVKVKDPPPIIMVVFDEFASTALQDAEGNIDGARFPHFAALSKNAYWFRNDTTVADTTHNAIPAILTGDYVKSFRLPNAASYPRNLFTLLGGQYGMKVLEQTTHLCPDRLFKRKNDPFPERMESLLADLSVVYLHIILPQPYTTVLPDISQNWQNFRTLKVHYSGEKDSSRLISEVRREELEALKNDRITQFRHFVDSIRLTRKPTLYFLHSLLPHTPYNYLPSGKRYSYLTRIEGLHIGGPHNEEWENDPTLVVEAYRRFLLQVGCVDTLLGELIGHLKEIGLYERSLIIITADHGVSFRSNDPRRALTETTSGDILPVPLFVKVPHQERGVIDDHNVESIDILPTIAEILGVRLPGRMDGHAAIGASLIRRKKKIAYDSTYKRFLFPEHLKGKSRTLKWKLAYFGTGAEPPRSHFGSLVGKRVFDIGIARQSIDRVQLDQEVQYQDINPGSHFMPAEIKGSIVFDRARGPDRLDLAVAVNGIVRAVTGTFWQKKNSARFSTVVPEASFVRGKNKVGIFIVAPVEGKVELVRTGMDSALGCFLKTSGDNGAESICSQGRTFQVIKDALEGHLDSVRFLKDTVVFNGWAADMKRSEAAQSILVFVDGRLSDMFSCDMERPDVAKFFGNASLKLVGFKVAIPLSQLNADARSQVRLFALSRRGEASELIYPKNYPWGLAGEASSMGGENEKK
jgi:hypothetical protein